MPIGETMFSISVDRATEQIVQNSNERLTIYIHDWDDVSNMDRDIFKYVRDLVVVFKFPITMKLFKRFIEHLNFENLETFKEIG